MVFSLMVVFIIHVPYLAILDLKRQTPVARNMQAPDSFAIPGELVGPPQWGKARSFSGSSCMSCRNVSMARSLVHGVRRQAPWPVLQIEHSESFVGEGPYFHSFIL
jgi:hypothetical protein